MKIKPFKSKYEEDTFLLWMMPVVVIIAIVILFLGIYTYAPDVGRQLVIVIVSMVTFVLLIFGIGAFVVYIAILVNRFFQHNKWRFKH